MKEQEQNKNTDPLTTELLILPDGRILVHNLTGPFADLLLELNPDAQEIRSRASTSRTTPHDSLPHGLPD